MKERKHTVIGVLLGLAFSVAILCLGAGCSSQKPPDLADVKGTNVPKLDPKMVRAKMADAMGKMNAAGGFKRIDPSH